MTHLMPASISMPVSTPARASAWHLLRSASQCIVEIADAADFPLNLEDDDTLDRYCRALDDLSAACTALNHPGARQDWRADPARTRYREDYDLRILVHVLRNRRRHDRIPHAEAADILEDRGLDAASIQRLLGEFLSTPRLPEHDHA